MSTALAIVFQFLFTDPYREQCSQIEGDHHEQHSRPGPLPRPQLVHQQRVQPGGPAPHQARAEREGLASWRSTGRTSGEPRRTVVNLLTVDGVRYLVAPRGETQWVRNLRAAGSGTLRVGRRTEAFTADGFADDAKPEIIRAYLKAWAWEVGRFFEGITADSPDADIAAVAAGFPVFRIG